MSNNSEVESSAKIADGGGVAVAAVAPQSQEIEEGKGLSIYAIAGIAVFVSMMISLSLLAGYHTFFAKKTKVGMVDIASILETSELVFTEMLSGERVTDADREAAFELVRQTGPKLDAAIAELQASCECVLLTKAAVIGSEPIDYTPLVKTKLGIDTVDTKSLQERIRKSLNPKGAGGSE